MHTPGPVNKPYRFRYDGQPTRAILYWFGQIHDEPGYTGRDLDTAEFRIFAGARMTEIEPPIVEPMPGQAKSVMHATAAVLAIVGQLLSGGGNMQPQLGTSTGIHVQA